MYGLANQYHLHLPHQYGLANQKLCYIQQVLMFLRLVGEWGPSFQNNYHPVFLLIDAPGATQNMDSEPLLCTQFAKQKVCPILSSLCSRKCQDEIIIKLAEIIIRFFKHYYFNQLSLIKLS